MNSTRDDQPLPELEEVRKAYRDAGFNDEPPAHVDAFIRAAGKRESKRNLNDYLPSLAMAATVVLALGLVLRLTLPGRDLVAPTAVPVAEDAAGMRLVQNVQPRITTAKIDSLDLRVNRVEVSGFCAHAFSSSNRSR